METERHPAIALIRAPLAPDEVRIHLLDSGDSATVRDATQRLLALQLDVAPAAIVLGVQGKGKPVLDNDPSLHFSISHSHDVSMVALTRVAPVGIDIERVRTVPHAEMILHRFFPAEVVSEILTDDNRDLRFVEAWTRSEATVKVRGASVWEAATPDPRVTVGRVTAPEGFAASVAVRGAEWRTTQLEVRVAELRDI